MFLRITILACLSAVLLCPSISAQELEHAWSARFGDGNHQTATAAARDPWGNFVIAGSFLSTVDFGGGPLTSAGAMDIFVAKFDADGNHLWSRCFGDAADGQVAWHVECDGLGNIIMAGGFDGAVDFGGGPLMSAGYVDIWVAALDPDGNHLWSSGFGSAGADQVWTVAVDAAGHVMIGGSFESQVDFGGGLMVCSGDDDAYIATFDAAGNHLWSQKYGDAAYSQTTSIFCDGSNNVILAGYFDGTIDMGGGPLTSAGGHDVYLAKLDASGNHMWSQCFGDASYQVPGNNSVAVDASGNILMGGAFQGAPDFGGGPLVNAGSYDLYLVKFDPTGAHLWSRAFGDANRQFTTSVRFDESGSIFHMGFFRGTVDFGGGPLTSTAGSRDIYLAKLDANGNHIWSDRWGDAANQRPFGLAPYGGAVYIAGEFYGSVDFGGGSLASAGLRDVFIAKFEPNVTPVAIDIKPGACPNPLNIRCTEPVEGGRTRKGGVIAVAIAGSAEFDVQDIDVSSITLVGVAPARWSVEDVSTHWLDADPCACAVGGPDGWMDLNLKFGTNEIGAALGAASVGDMVTLTLTGTLLDGTPIEGKDCILIVGPPSDPPSGGAGVALEPATPNPFNPVVTLRYSLPEAVSVRLAVYDVSGRRVATLVDAVQTGGDHAAEWNARDHASGVYFYRLVAGEEIRVKRMVLLK